MNTPALEAILEPISDDDEHEDIAARLYGHLNGGRRELAALNKSHADLLAALQVLLDQVDYTAGACTLTEMVGAVLPKQVIAMCRTAIAAAKGNQS